MIVNLRLVARQLGLLILVLSAVFVFFVFYGLLDNWYFGSTSQADVVSMLLSAGLTAAAGGLLILLGRTSKELIGRREAILLVVCSWIFGAAVSAMPFRIWAELRPDADGTPHPFDSYVDCYFEAMSGLTTAGSTILPKIGTLPRSLLLWRSTTHWLGGLGIVVLFVAVLPLLGVGGRRLLRIEGGPTRSGVRPQIKDAARALWIIYLGITVIGAVGLRLAGMSWFDAVNHTFAALATGGFSTQDASIGAFASTPIHLVAIAIMLAGSINFALYHQAMLGKWRAVLADPELRLFFAFYVCGVAVVMASLWLQTPKMYLAEDGERLSGWIMLRDAAFQTASIHSTTGFATVDYDQWAFPAKATLVLLCFVGGCVGATTGGLKVSRILIGARVAHEELERLYEPSVVRATIVGKAAIPADVKLNTVVLIALWIVTFGAGTAALMISEGSERIDIISAATATAAVLNTTGPGLGLAGPATNFAWISPAGKLILSAVMILGRLEIFTIVVLFLPGFWRGD